MNGKETVRLLSDMPSCGDSFAILNNVAIEGIDC